MGTCVASPTICVGHMSYPRTLSAALAAVVPLLNQCATRERQAMPPVIVVAAPEPEPASSVPAAAPAAGRADVLTDQSVLSAVRWELSHDPFVDPELLEVRIEDGIVELSGTVDTVLAAHRAVAAAQVIRGVRAVVNRIQVLAPDVPDEALSQAVREALQADPATDSYELGVSADRGAVLLEGVVQSPTELQLAEQAAWSVSGVRQVDNQIQLAPVAHRADAEIRAGIERRLAIDAHLDDEELQVSVLNGRVALSGEVGSVFEQNRALASAWVTGVSAVDASRVRVVPESHDRFQRHASPQLSNLELAAAVRDALRVDPRVDERAIWVRTKGGIVDLAGVVSSLAEKRAAEVNARNTVGAWEVRSHLTIRARPASKDEALVRAVTRRLHAHPAITLEGITVSAEDGRLLLEGAADDRFERTQAALVAGTVPGVQDVENRLELRQPSRRLTADEVLEREIETALFWDSRVDLTTLDVEVFEGTAIVAGTVPDAFSHEAVLENVRSAGPAAIEDRLRRIEMPIPAP